MITSLLRDMAYKHQNEKTSEQSAFIVKKFKEYLDNYKAGHYTDEQAGLTNEDTIETQT